MVTSRVSYFVYRCPSCKKVMGEYELVDGRCPCGSTPEQFEFTQESSVLLETTRIAMLSALLTLVGTKVLGILDMSWFPIMGGIWLYAVINLLSAYGVVRK